MVRTFLDSDVLLAAARSLGRDKERALEILEDPDRTFLTSPFVHLELVPNGLLHSFSTAPITVNHGERAITGTLIAERLAGQASWPAAPFALPSAVPGLLH